MRLFWPPPILFFLELSLDARHTSLLFGWILCTYYNIHKLAGLRFLNVSTNKFNGDMNWEFSMLKELEVLDAYNNDLSSTFCLLLEMIDTI
ncbi:hypothetical protein VNO80_06153 [Phaseolus coccineus]|uniref:Uncharacterized protein n=1 Tax=Phaseolus coccineus TaxID=3886 RepID=A0AAN9NGD5_PHACN